MTACPTHGALLGGYILGSLDPAEMDEMRLHVADCPYCGPEARTLAVLPPLLDTIEPADVPPPALSPAVAEAVLDRFTRERARGLPAGAMYELWCVRADGHWVSGGTFRPGHDGRAYADLTAAVRPGDYHVMVVTRHTGDEAEHGPALLRGSLRY